MSYSIPSNPITANLRVDEITVTTLNPALSLPYIKYYTSFMEEYQRLVGYKSNPELGSEEISKEFTNSGENIFPSYLRYSPYESMNAFPTMQVYKTDRAITSVFNKDNARKPVFQNVVNERDNVAIINNEPIPERQGTNITSNSDIILSYKKVSSRTRFAREIKRGNKADREPLDIVAVLNNLIGIVKRNILIGFVIDNVPTGNSSAYGSYLKGPWHAMYRTGSTEIETIRKQWYKDIVASALVTVRDMERFFGDNANIQNKGLINNFKGKLDDYKSALESINTGSSKITSYMQIKGCIIAYSMFFISEILSEFIRLGPVNITNNMRLSKLSSRTIAEVMMDQLPTVLNNKSYIANTKSIYTAKSKTDTRAMNAMSIMFDNLLKEATKGIISNKNSNDDEVKEQYNLFFRKTFGIQVDKLGNTFTYLYMLKNQRGNLDDTNLKVSGVIPSNLNELQNDIKTYNGVANESDTSTEYRPTALQDSKIKIDIGNNVNSQVNYSSNKLTSKNRHDNKVDYKTVISNFNNGIIGLGKFVKTSSSSVNMRWKSLVIKNEEKKGISTTVTKFDISRQSRNIPIFMDGHSGPMVQNFGGPLTTIHLSIITNDPFMLDNISEAAQELDISYRTRSETNNPSPLGASLKLFSSGSKVNSLVYDRTRRNIQSRLKKLSSVGGQVSSNIDSPILITNNVANMAGAYGAVINQIEVNTVPDFPSHFQIDLDMTVVDVNQQFRDTPRKKNLTIDPGIILANICRTNQLGLGTNGTDGIYIPQVNNIQRALNAHLSKYIIIHFLAKYALPGERLNLNVKAKERGRLNDQDRAFRFRSITRIMIKAFIKDFFGPLCNRILNTDNEAIKSSDIVKEEFTRLFKDFNYKIRRTYEEEELKKSSIYNIVSIDIVKSGPRNKSTKKVERIISIADSYNFTALDDSETDVISRSIEIRKGVNDKKLGGSITDTGTLALIFSDYLNKQIGGNTALSKDLKLVGDKLDNPNFEAGRQPIYKTDLLSNLITEISKFIPDTITSGDTDLNIQKVFSEYGRMTSLKPENLDVAADQFGGILITLMKEIRKYNIPDTATLTPTLRSINQWNSASGQKSSNDKISKLLSLLDPKSKKNKEKGEDGNILTGTEMNGENGHGMSVYLYGLYGFVAYSQILRKDRNEEGRMSFFKGVVTLFNSLNIDNKSGKINKYNNKNYLSDYYGTAARTRKKLRDTYAVGTQGGNILIQTNNPFDLFVPEGNFTVNDPFFVGRESTVSIKLHRIIMYRMIDSIGMNVVLPLARRFMSKVTGDVNVVAEKEIITKITGLMDMYKAYDQLNKGNFKNLTYSKSASGFISPFLINAVIRDGQIDNAMFYDKYNAYPDLPLPVLANIKSTEVRGKLAALQLFTTPDFYIQRDGSYSEIIQHVISKRLASAKLTLENEIGLEADTSYRSSQSRAKDQLDIYSDSGRDILMEVKEKLYTSIEEFRNRITFYGAARNNKGNYDTKAAAIRVHGQNAVDKNSNLELQFEGLKIIHTALKKIDSDAYGDLKLYSSSINEAATLYTTWVSKSDAAVVEYRNSTDEKVMKGGVLTGLKSIFNATVPVGEQTYTIERIVRAASQARVGSGNVGSRNLDLLKRLVNPGAGAYNVQSMDLMINKMQRMKEKLNRVGAPSTTAMAYPTFKFYIIEEDAKELLFFNDFYDYASVKSIKVHYDRKSASATANVILSNLYGRLTNIIAGRRSNVENPFYVRPESEEKINSMMLRVGARIQIRLGYSSHLGPESIVFSGRIQSLVGTQEINIVAQSDGIELTRTIGHGQGTDLNGILGRLQNPIGGKQVGYHQTNNSLGLVTAILNEAKSPLRGLGTKSPFLGISRLRSITSDTIDGVTTGLDQSGYLGTLERSISRRLFKGISGMEFKLIDSRLTNINLSPADGNNGWFYTLIGRSRWIIHNETIWDALNDYLLQLGDRSIYVRPFDEENTIVIDSDDGVYQRSMENYVESSALYPVLTKLEDGERTASRGVQVIADLIRTHYNDVNTFGRNSNLMKYLKNMMLFTSSSMQKISDKDESTTNEQLNRNINKLFNYIGDPENSIVNKLYGENTYADAYDNAAADAIGRIREQVGVRSAEPGLKDRNYIEAVDIYVQNVFVLAAQNMCKFLKHSVTTSNNSFRPVCDVHMKTASKDIIKNNIKTVAGFNRVEVSYLDEDILGSAFQLIGMDSITNLLGLSKSITIDNINKPSSYATVSASVSNTIDDERVMTYGATQKNAAIRGQFLVDTPRIVANNILANLVKDYYDGDITILMDPTILTGDIIFIHDDLNDMWGIVQVKEVTHSFSPETGAVSIIKPDMYVKNNISSQRNTYSSYVKGGGLLKTLDQGASLFTAVGGIFLGRGITKIIGKVATPLASRVFKNAPGIGKSNMFKRALAISASKNKKKQGFKIDTKRLDGILDDAGEAAANNISPSKLTASIKSLAISGSPVVSKDISKSHRILLDHLIQTRGKFPKNVDSKTKEAIDDVIKNLASGKSKITSSNGLNNAVSRRLEAKIKNKDDLNKALDDVGEAFNNNSLFATSTSVNRASFASTYNDLLSIKKNSAGLINPFSFNGFKSIIGLGISSKIGRSIIPQFDGFSMTIGEYLNQNPIAMAGLVHKGEPMVAGLDGMRRGKVQGVYDWIEYKVGEAFNPIRELIGDVEDTMNEINDGVDPLFE